MAFLREFYQNLNDAVNRAKESSRITKTDYHVYKIKRNGYYAVHGSHSAISQDDYEHVKTIPYKKKGKLVEMLEERFKIMKNNKYEDIN